MGAPSILQQAEKGSSLGRDAWHRLQKNKLAMFSLWFFVGMVVLCFLLPLVLLLVPVIPGPNDTFPELKAAAPFSLVKSAEGRTVFYLFGSDHVGRDVFSRILSGGQISLLVGFIATFVSLTIGIIYGAIAGFFGGRLDAAMMRVVDILYALPFMILVIVLSAVLEPLLDTPAKKLFLLFAAIGAVEWLTMARIVRGQIQSLKKQEFVEAARSLGLSDAKIIFKHLVPNTLGPVIVYTTLTIPAVMRLEAILSFLGLGVQPPNASWGSLIKEGADRMVSDPGLLVFPALFFSVTLFCLNFLGDGLRDALDVKTSKD